MKLNRFLALAVMALLVVGAMGFTGYKASAQAPTPPPPAQVNDQSQADSAEVQAGPDTDTVDLQSGDQTGLDTAAAAEAKSVDGADAAPAGTPAITADQAKTAALAAHPGTVLSTSMDDENGKLIYSVEFDGGASVKVDALTGAVLGTETGQD